jgi:hypothetical protein
MKIAEKCDECGAERPYWMMAPHKCPAEFIRTTHKQVPGMVPPHWEKIETPEPHTAEEYFRGYLSTGSLAHKYPPEAA